MIKILYSKQLPQLNQFFSNEIKESLPILNQKTNFIFEDGETIVIKNAALYFEAIRQNILAKNNLVSEWDKKGTFDVVINQQKAILKELINQQKNLIILTNTKENDNFCEPNLPNKILEIFMAMNDTTINYVEIYEVENQELKMNVLNFRYGYLSKIKIDFVEEAKIETIEAKTEKLTEELIAEKPKIRKRRTKKEMELDYSKIVSTFENNEAANLEIDTFFENNTTIEEIKERDMAYFDMLIPEDLKNVENDEIEPKIEEIKTIEELEKIEQSEDLEEMTAEQLEEWLAQFSKKSD